MLYHQPNQGNQYRLRGQVRGRFLQILHSEMFLQGYLLTDFSLINPSKVRLIVRL